ncbi:hypothetical protein [Bradyrhizobium sp. AZCC 2289]|uniref:hypothetical protein n=1 Tax=Bradyrhizobium sp. AZCC 2289 TaxID=3117026 RepID=UPI002FF12556
MSKRDKIAVLGSALLLLAILTAGAVGLFKAYRYNEAPPESNSGSQSKSEKLETNIRFSFHELRPRSFV